MSALVPVSEPLRLVQRPDELDLHSWDYTKRALASPVNLALFGATLSMAVALNSAVMLSVAVLAQFLLVLGVARLRWFRELIDKDIAAEREAQRQRKIESILIQVSARHRESYEKISRLVERIELEDGEVAEGLELRDLIDRYLELALAHRRCQSALAACDRRSLERQLEILEQAVDRASTARMRQLVSRRLQILKSRIELYDTDQERLYALEHELATIVDLVELAHQKWTSRQVTHLADPDIERCLNNIEAAEAALREADAAALSQGEVAFREAAREAHEAARAEAEPEAQRERQASPCPRPPRPPAPPHLAPQGGDKAAA